MTHKRKQAAFIADVRAWTGAQEETLRIGTHSFTTLPSDIPANVGYRGLINEIGAIDRSVFSSNELTGSPQISEGFIELNNTGDLDPWLNYGFDGRVFTISRLDVASLYSSRRAVFTGTLIGLDASNAWTTLRLRIRDRLQELDTPLLTQRYAGTTNSTGPTMEGDIDLKDQIKPWILGSVRNITPKLVNSFDLIYQVSYKAVTSIAVKWGGESLPSSAADYLTVQALQAATIPPGQYATCLNQGLFRSGSSPAAVVTADVLEGGSLAQATVGKIARRLLQHRGVTDINTASFNAGDTFNSEPIGIFIDNDESALQLISRVLDTAGFALIPNLEGEFALIILRDPAGLTPVAQLNLNNIVGGASLSLLAGTGQSEGVPAYSVVLNYSRNYTPMDLSQLAGILTAAQKNVLAEEHKTSTIRDLTVQQVHPLATEITKDTLFINASSADAEATRLLNLMKVRRDRISVSMNDVHADEVELGDCVNLIVNRFGFNLGKKFLVLAKQHQFRTRTVALGLWG